MDNSKQFKALQTEWYKKAADSGFSDIESSRGWEKKASPGVHFYKAYGHQRLAANQRYFELAGHFLHENSFLSESEKEIWQNYCEGLTIRAIVAKTGSKRYLVHAVILRLEKEMLAKYTKEVENEQE